MQLDVVRHEALRGKTVEAVIRHSERIVVLFTDGSIWGLSVEPGEYDGDSPWITEDDDLSDIHGTELITLGLKTKEDYEAERAAKLAAQEEAQRQQRLREWRRLSKEFAGTEPVKEVPPRSLTEEVATWYNNNGIPTQA